MASTPNHAVQGALLTCLMLKLMHAVVGYLVPLAGWILAPLMVYVYCILGTLGAVLGALPDIIGWAGRVHEPGSWTLYREAHGGRIRDKFEWSPQYQLHVWVDEMFHADGEGHWWPRLWWMEIGYWLLNGAALWVLL